MSLSFTCVVVSKLDLPMRGKGACTRSQKPTETGTETFDTETACGIMALSQTKGHGIRSFSCVQSDTSKVKTE